MCNRLNTLIVLAVLAGLQISVAQADSTAQTLQNNATAQVVNGLQLKTELEKIESEMVAIAGKNYEIGRYEITQEIWLEVMGGEPWQARGISNPSQFKECGSNCPVENISWDDTQEFINMLNHKTGRQYRLPTEVEWEYACEGGSHDDYCGGNNIDALAWYEINSKGQTHPVGQKQANGYGLYDMSGNVEEWMGGCYSQFESEEEYCTRTLRGGSWVSPAEVVRAVSRSYMGSAFKYPQFGLRLARTIP